MVGEPCAGGMALQRLEIQLVGLEAVGLDHDR